MSEHNNKRVLGIFALTTMGIAAILSLRNLPIAAVYGYSVITFYILAALLFLIPSAVICTKFSTTWPQAGGLYIWVKKALGPHYGFLAIWFEWINTVISFPMMLGFILFSLIYPFTYHLANNKFFEFTFMVTAFWIITIINFFGIKTSSRFSAFGVVAGTLLIALTIIGLGITWLLSGHASQIHFSAQSLVPHLHFKNLAFLIVVINSLSGIQVIAFHAMEAKSPKKNYPRAALLITVIIVTLSILGALSIATVMPASSPSLIGGIAQSLTTYLDVFHLGWLVPILIILMAIGVLSEINAWVIGPSKGLLTAAEEGALPKILSFKNTKGVPISILLTQGIIGTALACAYIFMPSVNSAYWLLSDITAEFTVLMWVLVFISAIILFRYSKLICLMAMVAMLVCVITLALSYFPPAKVIHSNTVVMYESVLLGGLLLFLIIPLLITISRQQKDKLTP